MKINNFKKTFLLASILFVGILLLGNSNDVFARTNDVEITPPGSSIPSTSVNILENLDIGTSLGTLTLPKDNNANLPYTYSIACTTNPTGIDDEFFQINGDQLEVAVVLDYENPVDSNSDNEYAICVKGVTNNLVEYEQEMYFYVQDATNTPINLQIDGADTASQIEGTPANTTIGTFGLTEQDNGEGAGIYDLEFSCSTPGDDDNAFVINGSTIENFDVFDYTSPVDANSDNEYEVCVKAISQDTSLLYYEKNFIISVTALPSESTQSSSRKSSRRLTQDQVNELFGMASSHSSSDTVQQLQMKLISLLTQLIALMKG